MTKNSPAFLGLIRITKKTRMNGNSFQGCEYVDLDQGRIGERVRNWDLVGIWRIGSFMKG